MGLLRNIGVLVTGREGSSELQVIRDAALAWSEDQIQWVGESDRLPGDVEDEELDAGGRLVVPGLIDCHTHLAFGGWRSEELEERARGASYLDMARRGGGIMSTVRSTRSASADALLHKAAGLASEMLALGVTTVECKSGYGLTVDDEIKILEVYRSLSASGPSRIVPTFLGAHTVPAEYAGKKAEYLDLVCNEMIPLVAERRLAKFCDVFVEESAFSPSEGRRVLETGLEFGLLPKIHADQITSGGGAELAAAVGAVSADHLECATESGIRALARAGVTAVSLPIASLFLGSRPLNCRTLIDAGVRVAVATDFNPGTAPSYHLPMALMLACTMNRLAPSEALIAATINAAYSVGMAGMVGSLQPGKKADFAVVDSDSVSQWLYHFRPNAVVATFVGGQLVSGRLDGRSRSGRGEV